MPDVIVLDLDGKTVFNAGRNPGAYTDRAKYLARAQAAGFKVADNKVLAPRSEIWDALDL